MMRKLVPSWNWVEDLTSSVTIVCFYLLSMLQHMQRVHAVMFFSNNAMQCIAKVHSCTYCSWILFNFIHNLFFGAWMCWMVMVGGMCLSALLTRRVGGCWDIQSLCPAARWWWVWDLLPWVLTTKQQPRQYGVSALALGRLRSFSHSSLIVIKRSGTKSANTFTLCKENRTKVWFMPNPFNQHFCY